MHFVPVLLSVHETVPNVPSPELENSTVPGSFELSAEVTVAAQVVDDPSAMLFGEHFTVVEVGTS